MRSRDLGLPLVAGNDPKSPHDGREAISPGSRQAAVSNWEQAAGFQTSVAGGVRSIAAETSAHKSREGRLGGTAAIGGNRDRLKLQDGEPLGNGFLMYINARSRTLCQGCRVARREAQLFKCLLVSSSPHDFPPLTASTAVAEWRICGLNLVRMTWPVYTREEKYWRGLQGRRPAVPMTE